MRNESLQSRNSFLNHPTVSQSCLAAREFDRARRLAAQARDAARSAGTAVARPSRAATVEIDSDLPDVSLPDLPDVPIDVPEIDPGSVQIDMAGLFEGAAQNAADAVRDGMAAVDEVTLDVDVAVDGGAVERANALRGSIVDKYG